MDIVLRFINLNIEFILKQNYIFMNKHSANIYALLMVLSLMCFVFPAVFRNFLIYENASTYFLLNPKTVPNQYIDFGIYAILIFVLFFSYYKFLNNFTLSKFEVICWCIVIALFAVFMSSTSFDLYDYIAQGRLHAKYGLNPYLSTRASVANWQNDALLNTSAWHVPSVYGPLWLMVSRLLSLCDGDSLLVNIFLYKFLFFLFHLINIVLIYKISKSLNYSIPTFIVSLYAFNPLIFMELIGNGHNDVMLLTFLFLSIYSITLKKFFWVLPFLGLSICVKHISVLLALPLFIWLLKYYKNKIFYLLLSSIITILEIVIFYSFYWRGPKIFDYLIFQQQKFSAASLHYFLTRFFQFPDTIEFLLIGIFVVLYLHVIISFSIKLKSDDISFVDLMKVCSTIFLLFYYFGLKWWQSWYISWVIPFALFLNPKDAILRLTMLISFFSLIGSGLFLIWGYTIKFQYGFFLFSFVVSIFALFIFKKLYPKSNWKTIRIE